MEIKKTISRMLFLSTFLLVSADAYGDIIDMTDEVFGAQTTRNILPMAFLDFNGDRLTDMVVVGNESKTVSVFLAVKQNLLGQNVPFLDTEVKDKKLECKISDGHIVSVIPGDFDGDGSVDILVVIKKADQDHFFSKIIWTERVEAESQMNCTSLVSDDGVPMMIEPILLDANGDNIADLFGVNNNQTKGFWIFSGDRYTPAKFEAAEPITGSGSESGNVLQKTHSNAFVDLNEDGNADLLITNKNSFEIWENVGSRGASSKGSSPNFRFSKTVDINDCNDDCLVGQVAFSDFDMNGTLDVLFPVCLDGIRCSKPGLLFSRAKDMFDGREDFQFQKIEFDSTGNWTFDFRDDVMRSGNIHPFRPLTPRVGDINLDGFPDLLLRLKNVTTSAATTHLLLSVERPCDKTAAGFPRAFEIQVNMIPVMSDVIAATFIDIYDDGLLDILTLKEDVSKGGFTIGAYTNKTLSSNGYFMKVIVLSGVCYNEDCNDEFLKVPYGTNMPGQTVCYKTQHNNLIDEQETKYDSCAPQLTQTAHTPLQLPYTYFGLGSNLNFIDSLTVKVTNASSHSQIRTFTQVIFPNAQLYVIPYPSLSPQTWMLKLFITPSRNIMFTALSIIGIVLCLVAIIVALEYQEKRLDRKALTKERRTF